MREIPFSPPDIGKDEIKEVTDVLKSGWITTGPKTKEFEKRLAAFCHTERFVCLSSGTAALELTLRLFGIGPGDEVITSAYTYTATASAICHTGAKPVLIDVALDSYEMDYDAMTKAINERTKAIIPVDIAGIMCDYNKIRDIVDTKKSLFNPSGNLHQQALGRILILADSAHGLGAGRDGMLSGQAADFTAFSFHAVKNLTTGEGGGVTWRQLEGFEPDDIYKEFQMLSLHGQTKDAYEKSGAGSWEYDILFPAYKANMTDIQAALGVAQLKRYGKILERRRELVNLYKKGINSINESLGRTEPPLITSPAYFGDGTMGGAKFFSSRHLFMIRLNGLEEEDRNKVINSLKQAGISANVHYKPLPMLTAYKIMGYDIKDFPNAYAMYANEITLPLYTKLVDKDIDYVIESLEKALDKYKVREPSFVVEDYNDDVGEIYHGNDVKAWGE